MVRCLLTGAGGFIGAHTIAHIMHNTDWDLICLDSFRHKGKTDRIVEMMESHLEWRKRIVVITHDLVAPFSTQLIDRLGHVDYIINMASESHVDRSITDPVSFIKNNVDVAINTLEYARSTKPKSFIQVSTDEVAGPALLGKRHKEWATPLPSNPYSASKSCQEAIAFSYWRTYGVPVIVTRTMNNIGEMQDPEKFVPMLVSKTNAGEEVIIHGMGPTDCGSRFYLHARNHADALLFLLNNITVSSYSETIDRHPMFNVVGDVEMNNYDLAALIAKILDKPLKYKFVDFHSARPGHDRRYALDGSLLNSLGWVPPVPFKESLIKTIDWTLRHPEWLR
jgi:dTDP-glucose 4,6-dehydratase